MTYKETVGIHISCGPVGIPEAYMYERHRGPWTHCRSEGTYLLGIALNLARHGHDVTLFEYQWGNRELYPLPEGITLQSRISGEYDIYMGPGWDVGTPSKLSNIKAKMYCYLWGGNPFSSQLLDYVKPKGLNNHFMMRNSRASWKSSEEYPYSIYAPSPLVDKIKTKGNFDSNKMLWGNRHSFNTNYYYPNSTKVLEFMEKHVELYKYKVMFWKEIREMASKMGRTDILIRFRKLKDKNKGTSLETELMDSYNGIGHDEYLIELNQNKILLDSGHPGGHPQNLEAICMGCIPLLWKNDEHHFQNIIRDNNGKGISSINVNNIYGMDGPSGIDKILNDEKLYQEYYSALREVTLDHEYDIAYKICMNEIRKKGLL